MSDLIQASVGGKASEITKEHSVLFIDAYRVMTTLGGNHFSLTDLVPDQYADDLKNDRARLAMVSMLTKLLNNVYEKFNEVALECGAENFAPSVIRAPHLSPQDQLMEILRQAMRNIDIANKIAWEIRFDTRRADALKVRIRAYDNFSSSVEERAWVRIHSLSWVQSKPGLQGYPYLTIGMNSARTIMSPSCESLGEMKGSDGHIDVPHYLELLSKKVALMIRIDDLLDRSRTTRRFRKLICEHLHHAGSVDQLNRVAEPLETGAPMEWIESTLGRVQ